MITLGCLSRYPRKGEGLSVIILMKAELCFCRKTDLITLSGKLDEIEIGKWTKASKKKDDPRTYLFYPILHLWKNHSLQSWEIWDMKNFHGSSCSVWVDVIEII